VKRFIAAATVLVFLGLLPTRADTICPPPRCLTISVPVSPGLNVPDNHVRVILPAGYSDSATYPVLYLLHGAGGSYAEWTQNTDVVSFSSAYRLIIAMPDTGRSPNAGWYADWVDGSRQWESFHMNDVIPYIEATYHGNGKRAIAGLSMGGYGAMYYAASHPGEFKAAASFSGAVDIRYGAPVSGVAFSLLHDAVGTPNDNVWGNQLTEDANWRAHNPADLAAHLAGTKVFLASGDGFPGGRHEDPNNPGAYFIEGGAYQLNLSFARALTQAGIPHTDNFYGPGQHTWPYWQDDLHWVLPRILTALV
jgi:diacylglycerol O-acyltransferase/trehalose O-mycolyltransferase